MCGATFKSAAWVRKSSTDGISSFPRDNLLRVSGQPQDVQPGPCAVRTVNQPPIVHFDVIRFNHLLAASVDLRVAGWMADSILRTKRHGEFIWGGYEIGNLLHGKGIANIEYTCARIKPGKNCNLPVVGLIERFGHRVRAKAPSPAAIISRIFRNAESGNGPGRGFIADVHQECQVRPRSVAVRPRGAVIAARRFRWHNQQIPLFKGCMALELWNRLGKNGKGGVRTLVGGHREKS